MAAELPADAAEQIANILAGKDLGKTSLKEVRSDLEKKYGVAQGGFDSFRDKIKEFTTAEIARIQSEEAEAEASAADPEPAAAGDANTGKAAEKKGKKSKRESKAGDAKDKDKDSKGRGKGPGTKERQKNIMTKDVFNQHAETFHVQIGDKRMKVDPKNFSTGSSGFWGGAKLSMKVNGEELMMQCQVSCTVIGSKEWPES